MNREQKRKSKKTLHHNVFTKKYSSSIKREKAIESFMGQENYNKRRKHIKEQKKIQKQKKEAAKASVNF